MPVRTDNDIWRIIIREMDLWTAQFNADFNITVPVSRAFQPKQTNVSPDLVCHVFDIHTKRYGWQYIRDRYDSQRNEIVHIDGRIINTQYQVSAQDISSTDENAIRAFDALEHMSAFLQTPDFIQRIGNDDLEIFRITEVRRPYFNNDLNRYESDPSFDFMLSYTQERESVTPQIDRIEPNINRV